MTSMLSRRPSKPRVRVDSLGTALSKGPTSAPPISFSLPQPQLQPHQSRYPHTSTFRSLHMEMHLHSPSVKVIRHHDQAASRTLPIYGERDIVEGTITVAPQMSLTGTLTVSIEGAFVYNPPAAESSMSAMDVLSGQRRHVFYSATVTPFAPVPELTAPRSASIKGAFRTGLRKKTSADSLRSAPSPVQHFAFELPRAMASGDELPASFNTSHLVDAGPRGRASVESAEVAYRIYALWESNDGSDNRVLLEAPVIFQPDKDFHSLDGMNAAPDTWLEVPLYSDRSRMPIQCAVTIPNPASFSRSAAIPYFVVYTTTPKDTALSREIASDATIAVSLIRQITVPCPSLGLASSADAPVRKRRAHTLSAVSTNSSTSTGSSTSASTPSTPPLSSSNTTGESSGDEFPTNSGLPAAVRGARKLLRRSQKSLPRLPRLRESDVVLDISSSPSSARPPNNNSGLFSASARDRHQRSQERELPPLPPEARPFVETRTLQSEMFVGFPKRPRNPGDNRPHPTLEEQSAMPDGLYKGRMALAKDMLPSTGWGGFSIKHYLDVSVLFEQDELRARVPLRVY